MYEHISIPINFIASDPNKNQIVHSFQLKFSWRHKEFGFQSVDVEINLFKLPCLLQLPFVVCRLFTVSKNGEEGLATVGDVDALDELVIFDDRLGAGLPENVSIFLAGLNREQP